MKDQQLTVKIENNVLMISIGTDLLQHACVIGRRYGYGDIKITNEKHFLNGFIKQLSSEDSDGSTLIHEAFDKAVNEMLENGEHGVDLDEEY